MRKGRSGSTIALNSRTGCGKRTAKACLFGCSRRRSKFGQRVQAFELPSDQPGVSLEEILGNALSCRRRRCRRWRGERRTGNEGPTEEGRSGGAKWWWLRENSYFLSLIPAYVKVTHACASMALFRLCLNASIWPSLSSSPHDPPNRLPDSCTPQSGACRTHRGVARRRGREYRPAGEGVAVAACLIKAPGSRARVTGWRGCDGERNWPSPALPLKGLQVAAAVLHVRPISRQCRRLSDRPRFHHPRPAQGYGGLRPQTQGRCRVSLANLTPMLTCASSSHITTSSMTTRTPFSTKSRNFTRTSRCPR